jgi:hypothetical protein
MGYELKYQHVERIGTGDTKGLLDGVVYVSPKLDGTNGVIWYDNGVHFGSRNRELSLENDNAGFMKWGIQQESFNNFFRNNPYAILYGEWLVPHTIKQYKDDAWRNFYVFDIGVSREDKTGEKYIEYMNILSYTKLLDSFGIKHIPCIIMDSPSFEEIRDVMIKNKYLMKEGNIGEGVVCKNYTYRNKWGKQTWGKMIMPLRTKRKEIKDTTTSSIETQIIEKYLTEHTIIKEKDKICFGEVLDNKLLPKLFGIIWHTLITEEIWNIIKDFKSPIIDFKILHRLTIDKIKQVLEV